MVDRYTLAAVELTPVEIRFLCRLLPMVNDDLDDLDERLLFNLDRGEVNEMLETALENGLLGDEGVELLSQIEEKL